MRYEFVLNDLVCTLLSCAIWLSLMGVEMYLWQYRAEQFAANVLWDLSASARHAAKHFPDDLPRVSNLAHLAEVARSEADALFKGSVALGVVIFFMIVVAPQAFALTISTVALLVLVFEIKTVCQRATQWVSPQQETAVKLAFYREVLQNSCDVE